METNTINKKHGEDVVIELLLTATKDFNFIIHKGLHIT